MTTAYNTLRSIARTIDHATSDEAATLIPLACVAWALALAVGAGPLGYVLVGVGVLVGLGIPATAAGDAGRSWEYAIDAWSTPSAWDLDPSELPTVIVGPRPTVAPGRTVQPSWEAWGGAVVLA